jgi:NAD(P)-dependent dehydrogenase (short-subunit alcohol dehydrogenase family)
VPRAHEALGGLNAAVSCAGILGSGRVLGKDGPMPLSQFETTVRVNLSARSTSRRPRRARCSERRRRGRRARRHREHRSVAAYEGQIGQCAYSASKAASSA